jgi:REP element-mobilizing transposase RayT
MCSQIIKQVKTNTFSQIYIQVVFAVKGRASLVSKSWEEELYKYVSGIVTNKGQKMLAINGMPDHIHIFIAMKPTCCLSDLVREIKKASNVYIMKKKYALPNFNGNKDLAHFHIANPVYGM